jgi:competence protein ComEA
VLAGAAVVLAGSGLLLVVRRPAPPIRIIEAPAPTALLIQVDGAVLRPGLYRLPPGARLSDALTAAGGVRPDADPSGMNRARHLRDGERVTVPGRALATPLGPGGETSSVLDVNSATAGELETLPGVGPVLARRIVEHRTARGGFRRVDDLLEVKGVGPRLLERLRGRVVIR